MNILTRYAFMSNYNAEKLTKQEANAEGIGTNNFAKCDTDGDGMISIDEIIANKEACDTIINSIQAKIARLTQEEMAIKAEADKDKPKVLDIKEGGMNVFAKEDKQPSFKLAA